MKKIFTLIAATVLTVASFAADRKPSVTLKSSKNYEVVIDGKSYYSNNGVMEINLMRGRSHTIKVYEQSRGIKSPFAGLGGMFFNKGKRLVDASTFQVGQNDIDISIDFRGQISVKEDRFDHGKWNDRRDDRDHRDDKGGWDRH